MFQERILDWYGLHRRELPWRKDPLPYAIWVAEVMLQQTQVKTVLPYYERFLKEFPDVGGLARAAESEILSAWAGLGYYARARNIFRAARMIIENYGGEFPSTMKEFLNLPGVGRYTAGAVYSIAFNQPQPIVDGNVRRVISRLHGLAEKPSESFYWEQATAWIPGGRASTFNQAVMELGALICVPSQPACRSCPVHMLCIAGKKGLQAQIPMAKPRPTSKVVHLLVLALRRKDVFLLTSERPEAFIPGIWGLPHALLAGEDGAEKAARQLALRILDESPPLELCARIRHAITFRSILAYVFFGDLNDNHPTPMKGKKLRWAPIEEISHWTTSSLFRKALRAATAVKKAGKKGEEGSC